MEEYLSELIKNLYKTKKIFKRLNTDTLNCIISSDFCITIEHDPSSNFVSLLIKKVK